ncbi:uncharacterized protein LOC100839419 isoform X3 [Brachypodium distachyon]|nr:uncharacterized protein LOC100839419 isoform X3 [Brachypodium distachyon]PNT69415.1 hypothetical protein BRADI_3g54930v3 [Brachypodium distachyon]|eukprot:XP_024316432.1 uncharacterized protein LOC100839419 isoform X3 [Brachypodium distachyon]
MVMSSNSNGKSLERVVSRRALQAAPCNKAWALGFLSGVCAVYLLGAALPPVIQIPLTRHVVDSVVPAAAAATAATDGAPAVLHRKTGASVMQLYDAWSASLSLNGTGDEDLGSSDSDTPRPPHLDDCRRNLERDRRFDGYGDDGAFPPWTLWKGALGLELFDRKFSGNEEQAFFRTSAKSDMPYPPWIVGSDEENYPLTRQVQRDIWVHQHPPNCSDPSLRFLVADWERLPGFGMGAQLAAMSGLLAIAIKEKRILVTGYYNRADHDGCKGLSISSWSCYFFPETSPDCRKRAFELMQSRDSWDNAIVKVKENYTSKQIWAGRIPRTWGEPWKFMQPTTDVHGILITNHRKMDRRWWLAQAVRYLMRFQMEYTCRLLNVARHSAFGVQASELVLGNVQNDVDPPQDIKTGKTESDVKRLVWSDHKPYMPRPLLSMHVRMGDKACEMVVSGFDKYMELAAGLRRRFPGLRNIWLSTEMQEVIDRTKLHHTWNFYFTNVTRQDANVTMAVYEASLGRETGTNYPLVNFIMATEADFFIGALGSTWCYLIDGMRNTGGKVMSGYLSVNKDRF